MLHLPRVISPQSIILSRKGHEHSVPLTLPWRDLKAEEARRPIFHMRAVPPI
jgi:hypothetical protein